MVIYTSALVAILLREPEAPSFETAIAAAPVRLISAVSRVELSIVIEGRKGEAGRLDVERLIQAGGLEIATVTPGQSALAIEAFRAFGKGRHPAGLNIGDCFSYALARDMGEDLLFKGNDFARTDIRSALPPPR